MAESDDDATGRQGGPDRARRRLLKMAAYVPPTIIGTLALNEVACQVASTCLPATCNPATCNPATCGPATCMPATCMPSNCGPDVPCMPDSPCMPDAPCMPIS